mmetsp:Transcript_7893/g.48797  ORF Transcript_7893/g.48797 Transcript_7893/m.48797 type:complete len:189 (+) Transcript_7893:155-721(+)
MHVDPAAGGPCKRRHVGRGVRLLTRGKHNRGGRETTVFSRPCPTRMLPHGRIGCSRMARSSSAAAWTLGPRNGRRPALHQLPNITAGMQWSREAHREEIPSADGGGFSNTIDEAQSVVVGTICGRKSSEDSDVGFLDVQGDGHGRGANHPHVHSCKHLLSSEVERKVDRVCTFVLESRQWLVSLEVLD